MERSERNTLEKFNSMKVGVYTDGSTRVLYKSSSLCHVTCGDVIILENTKENKTAAMLVYKDIVACMTILVNGEICFPTYTCIQCPFRKEVPNVSFCCNNFVL